MYKMLLGFLLFGMSIVQAGDKVSCPQGSCAVELIAPKITEMKCGTNNTEDLTFTLISHVGSIPIDEKQLIKLSTDSSPSSNLAFTGGTCGDSIPAGSTGCTIIVTITAAPCDEDFPQKIAYDLEVTIPANPPILITPIILDVVSQPIIYNNIPLDFPGNLPSEAFEAQTVGEFGGQVQFAGTARNNPTVTVTMSSWGCETGNWNSNNCSTASGSTFNLPITLNIYPVDPDNVPGTRLATLTKNFDIPFRPSADNVNCTDGRWYDTATSTCYNGFANNIAFDFTNLTLPEKVIISVAYNTSHYGYQPYGEQTTCYTSSGGCGYDSLNVGLHSPPTVGSLPLPPNNVYIYAKGSYGYCDNGDTEVFRLTTTLPQNDNCWANLQPAFQVTASD